MDSILVSWQALGADGHYHDTENMMLIAKVSAVIVSIAFALRGFANASEKYCKQNPKQNPRDAAVLGEESAPPSPSARSRGTSSPTIPGAWFPFFPQNTPSMPPSMRSMNTLVPTL